MAKINPEILIVGGNPRQVRTRIIQRAKETIMALNRLSEGEFFNKSKETERKSINGN